MVIKTVAFTVIIIVLYAVWHSRSAIVDSPSVATGIGPTYSSNTDGQTLPLVSNQPTLIEPDDVVVPKSSEDTEFEDWSSFHTFIVETRIPLIDVQDRYAGLPDEGLGYFRGLFEINNQRPTDFELNRVTVVLTDGDAQGSCRISFDARAPKENAGLSFALVGGVLDYACQAKTLDEVLFTPFTWRNLETYWFSAATHSVPDEGGANRWSRHWRNASGDNLGYTFLIKGFEQDYVWGYFGSSVWSSSDGEVDAGPSATIAGFGGIFRAKFIIHQ